MGIEFASVKVLKWSCWFKMLLVQIARLSKTRN
nr:MAG TPA: hypothetical protein [Caudoviricetes sp.]